MLDGVTLASLHAAKGLEWDVVFLAGLTDGMLPIVYAQTDEAIEEERRLLYVGVTRARDLVCLSWALARSAGGGHARKSSRFIEEMRPRVRRPESGALPANRASPARTRSARRAKRPGGSKQHSPGGERKKERVTRDHERGPRPGG